MAALNLSSESTARKGGGGGGGRALRTVIVNGTARDSTERARAGMLGNLLHPSADVARQLRVICGAMLIEMITMV